MAGTVTIGSEQFRVDMQEFAGAIATITSSRNAIEDDFGQIKSLFNDLHDHWQSPSGDTFESLQTGLTNSAAQMVNVLNDIVYRMNITYQNYQEAETVNAGNLGH